MNTNEKVSHTRIRFNAQFLGKHPLVLKRKLLGVYRPDLAPVFGPVTPVSSPNQNVKAL